MSISRIQNVDGQSANRLVHQTDRGNAIEIIYSRVERGGINLYILYKNGDRVGEIVKASDSRWTFFSPDSVPLYTQHRIPKDLAEKFVKTAKESNQVEYLDNY